MKTLSKLVLALTLTLAQCAPAQAAQIDPERIHTFYHVARSQASTFSRLAEFLPEYRGLAQYFTGRADAFADVYFVLTGERPQ
jgi:hypothetical protein